MQSVTPECTHSGLGFFPFARRYLGNRVFFLLLRVLRCFSSPGSSPATMDSSLDGRLLLLPGSPIRTSAALRSLDSSPQLFAVWHVLLHFRVARHPPYALPYLISGSRVFFEILLHKNCFLLLSFSQFIFQLSVRPFLLCLFFMLFSFQRSIPLSDPSDPSKPNKNSSRTSSSFSTLFLLRKEVIHPHVPVGIPCYDLTPVIGPTFDGSPLAVMPPASGITNSHGLTGGVYKARERIHRGMLIRDY